MKVLRHGLLAVSAFVLVAGGAPQSSLAVPIGAFSAFGTLQLDSDDVVFLPLIGGGGDALVSAPTTGSFVGLEGTAATLTDLNLAAPPLGSVLLTFAAAPTLSLTLTALPVGPFGSAQCGLAAAAGQTCTPTGSPLSFANFDTGFGLSSLVSFAVSGTATDGAGTAPFTGIFTAQFIGMSYQSVLATLAGGGTVMTSYSASFDVVPEPGTLMLVGAALATLAMGRRRR
jgi:PEP-CTERM motif